MERQIIIYHDDSTLNWHVVIHREQSHPYILSHDTIEIFMILFFPVTFKLMSVFLSRKIDFSLNPILFHNKFNKKKRVY